jgi:carbonic anhydrase
MARRLGSFSVFLTGFLIFSGCSTFDHHQQQKSDAAKPTTPLDMPNEKAPDADADLKKTQTPVPASTDAAAADGTASPTVTLVHKDGTPLNPTDTVAKTESAKTDGAGTATAAGAASGVTTAEQKVVAEEAKAPWSYSGERGPEHWGELKPEYVMCRDGHLQSPVDLKWHRPIKGGPLSFTYKSTQAHVADKDNGGFEIAFDAGSQIKMRKQTFDLMSAHFHTESEHTLSGKHYPLELHMVHKDSDGKPVVVAVMFKVGKENHIIDRIWSAASGAAPAEGLAFNPEHILPVQKTYYEYLGSFTTPPCTEDVTWFVFNTPVEISEEQLALIKKRLGENARPVQPLNGRTVKNY